MGLIYIQEEALWGEKLSRLATIYILILKILYDEQMASVSSITVDFPLPECPVKKLIPA